MTLGSARAVQSEGSDPVGQPRAASAVLSDRLIVKMRPVPSTTAIDPAARMSVKVAANRMGRQLTLLRGLPSIGAHVLKLDRPIEMSELQKLANDMAAGDPAIEYVEPDRLMAPQWLPNDPWLIGQWHVTAPLVGINVLPAWDLSRGKGVVVAVIDTGVRPHADLVANLLPGHDFVSDADHANDGDGRDADASDPGNWVPAGFCGAGSPAGNSNWHGTHVAGTVAATTNNGIGGAGVAPEARILPVRVMGRCGARLSDIVDGMVWAAGGSVPDAPTNAHPAQVLNLSLGGAGACGPAFQDAINAARSRGAVVVVSAGNQAADAANQSPANCAGVIAVGATNHLGKRAAYSNFGKTVDVSAPGGEGGFGVLSTTNTGKTRPEADTYGMKNGTSMAAPHVAGVVALMLSRNPTLTPDEVEALLKSSAAEHGFPFGCDQCGAGIVDAYRAVVAAGTAATRVSEVEPNDTLATAQKVTVLPALISGGTPTVEDVDNYSVVIPAWRSLTAVLIPAEQSDQDLSAVDMSGKVLATSGVAGLGVSERLTVRNASNRPSTVVLRVTPRAVPGRAGAYGVGNYTLAITQ